MSQDKNLFIIAGPNGAGKTTAAFKLLPDFLLVNEYVNADAIANGISPFRSESVAIQAGRVMLERIRTLLKLNQSFAFETTLSSKSFVNVIKKSKEQEYHVNIIYLWLDSVELAIERVKRRVAVGGHDIPADVIRRRYYRSLNNFFDLYQNIADTWVIYNNSGEVATYVAEKVYQDHDSKIVNCGDRHFWDTLKLNCGGKVDDNR